MNKLKIGHRLALGFTCVLAMVLVLAGTGIWRMHAAAQATDTLVASSLRDERLLADWRKAIELNAVRAVASLRSTDAAQQKALGVDMAASSARAEEIQNGFVASVKDPAMKALLDTLMATRKAYTDSRKVALQAVKAGDQAEALRHFEADTRPKLAAYLGAIQKMTESQAAVIDAEAAAIATQYDQSRSLLLAVSALAVLAGVAFSIGITRSVTTPLAEAVALANRVADGDLSARIVSTARDETGALITALGRMNDNLAGLVSQVRAGTDTIATASREIAHRQPRPVVAHRAAGVVAGGDRVLDGGADLHRQAERRQRAPGQPAGRRRVGRRRQGRRGGGAGGRHDGRDQRSPRARSSTSSASSTASPSRPTSWR